MKQHPKIVAVAENGDAQTERLLYEHYCRTGKVIPQTPEEVARAETEDAKTSISLPARLRNPDLFGVSPCNSAPQPLRFPTQPTTTAAQNLARAAREGGNISPAIEAKMEQDRKQAEREADGEDSPSK